MTQDEKAALIAERTELQRVYLKRKGVAGYGASADALKAKIEAIDAQLDAPEPQEPEETLPPLSLAGRTLGDPDATTTERRLAARVLSDARDGPINYDDA